MSYKPHSMTGQKTVRIDDRTVICVSVNVPDSEARESYIKKRETKSMVTESPRWKNHKKKVEEKIIDIPEEVSDLDLSEAELEALEEDDSEDSE